MMKNSTNISKYKRLAPIYDLIFGKFFIGGRKRAISLLDIKPSSNVLMVGVGTGEDFCFLPDECKVTGIDISDAMLSKAREKIRNKNIELYNMNAEKMDIEGGKFDISILSLVLSVTENPKLTMAETLRVTKNDGTILIFDKFIKSGKKNTLLRKALNSITSLIGTDINRSFEEIANALPLTIIKDEPSIFRGNYRIILVKKRLST